MNEALDKVICSKEWRRLWEKGTFARGYSPEGQMQVDAALYALGNELFGIPGGAAPLR